MWKVSESFVVEFVEFECIALIVYLKCFVVKQSVGSQSEEQGRGSRGSGECADNTFTRQTRLEDKNSDLSRQKV